MSTRSKPVRGDQRTRILAAARGLFGERGLDLVTMSDVADAAGVARATVFNHFGSKRALVEGITDGVLTFYRDMLERALADRATPVPVLIHALFDQMGIGIEEDRRLYRSVFREIAKLRLGLDEGTAGQLAGRAALETLEHLMTRGQARLEFTRRFRPEDLASAFDSLVNGTITHWLYDDTQESLRSRMERAAEFFLHAATGSARAPAGARRDPVTPVRDRKPRHKGRTSGARRKPSARTTPA